MAITAFSLSNISIGTKIAGAVTLVGLIGLAASYLVSRELSRADAVYSQMLDTAPPAIYSSGRASRRVNDMLAQTYKVIAYPTGSKGEADGLAQLETTY